MAAHKPPKGALDVKNGPGGLVALEFAMQVTQLASGRCHDPHIPTALACLSAAGLAPAAIAAAHRRLAAMLVMLRLPPPDGEPSTPAGPQTRKTVVSGKSMSVRVDLQRRRTLQSKSITQHPPSINP